MNATRAIGVLIAFAALLGMSYASSASMGLGDRGDAFIRLSIAARPERIETCRTVSDQELAKVAPQMRQRVICEGTTARYQLQVHRNEELLLSQMLRGGGLRHDRRMYVLHDIRVPRGPSTVRASIVRIDTVAATTDSSTAGDDDEQARRQRGREAAIPAEVRVETTGDVASGEVLLIMYEPEQRRLVARQPGPAGGER